MPDVIIIGAGVTGLSTAYHLVKRNAGRITVIDKGPVGDGSSSRAAGICTGLLWSEAGVRVRKRCFDLYEELTRDLPGYSFRRVGCLNLFTADAWRDRRKLLPLYDALEAPYEVQDPPRCEGLELDGETVGLYDPQGGYSEPSEYLPAITAALRRAGVEILENQPVTGILTANGAIQGVSTPAGPIYAGAVVCTVYSWTRLLLGQLGLGIPVKAFVHQRYELSPVTPLPHLPAVNANPLGIYFRPAPGGRILAGIETLGHPEFEVPDPAYRLSQLTVDPELGAIARDRLARILPASKRAQIETESVGLLTFSLDGEPILGPVSQYPGLYLGLAFHSGGFAYNPGTGELLAQYVTQGRTAIDVTAWSPDRFDPDESERYLATPLTQAESFQRRH